MGTNVTCWAGAAACDITPAFGVELIGGNRPDPRAEGVLHPISATALVLRTSSSQVCLVSIDSLGLTVALADELRAAVAQGLDTAADAVMISFTHSHSAPAPLARLGGARYVELLTHSVLAASQQAARRVRPCLAGWAMGHADIAENRRPGCDLVDNRLGALLVADASSRTPIALVVRATAHPNILMTSRSISSDFVGMARAQLERDFACPVLFIQGAAGNLKPAGVDTIRGGTVVDAERLGHRLAQRTRALSFEPKPVDALGMDVRDVDLIADVPGPAEARRIADEARAVAGIDGTSWIAECARLRAAGIVTQPTVRHLQALRVNEGLLQGLPDELFCEIALAAAAATGSALHFLNGYTNGCTGYLANRAELEKGGYEPVYSFLPFHSFHDQVASFRPDSADRIVAAAAAQWHAMMGDF